MSLSALDLGLAPLKHPGNATVAMDMSLETDCLETDSKPLGHSTRHGSLLFGSLGDGAFSVRVPLGASLALRSRVW